MQIFGLVFFILMAVVAASSLIYLIVRMSQTIKNPMPKTINHKKEVKISFILIAINALSFFAMMLSIYPWANISPTAGEWAQAIFGSLFTGLCFSSFIFCFFFHYYGKNIPEKLDKWLFRISVISVPLTLIFFFIMSNGYADYLKYPLVNGLSFTQGWVTPYSGKSSIAFYAIFIISGALLTYVICDHRMYLQYGKHGTLESTFLIAFPAGIIGARIAYVIGDWSKFADRVAHGEWWSIFAIWEGGLTILGGAIVGAAVGILWFCLRKKQYSIWVAVDLIIPAILVAQAVGRWGNFFNLEVHGNASPIEYWYWIPKVVQNNMYYSEFAASTPGMIFVPLFLIESMTNLLGYFVLAWFFGKLLRNYTEFGDLAFGYLIWYGYTRTFMEPLRHEHYNMGDNGYWSWFWSIIFVVMGATAIVLNHVIRFIIRKKKEDYVPQSRWINSGLIGSGIILVSSLALIIPGSILMASNPFAQKLNFGPYNVGIILLASGLSLFIFLAVSIFFTYEGFKGKKLHEQKV